MTRALYGRRILPAFLLLAVPAYASISRPAQTPLGKLIDNTIRVRLSEGTSVVRVHGLDVRIFSGSGARKLASVSDRQSEWELRCEDGRVRARRASGEGVGESTLDLPEPAVIRSPAGFLRYKGRPYRDELLVYSVGSLCEVVNQLDLEKYLEGLVNAEFNSRWSEEAIGAQVVAARTYAVFQIRQAKGEEQHYDVDSSTYDQVYDGSLKEDPRASRIVAKTQGWILTVNTPKGLEPLKAYYHSNCGGKTELPEKVWGTSNLGFRRVSDPYCVSSPHAHWSFDVTDKQIIESLRRAGRNESTDFAQWPKDWKKLLANGRLQSLRISDYDASGRVDQITLSFVLDGKTQDWTMTGAKFRLWVGPAQFKSTSFQVQLASPGGKALAWRFSGRGNGHGVGMCQWGAKAMGDQGFKTAAILKFYYPDAQLRKFW